MKIREMLARIPKVEGTSYVDYREMSQEVNGYSHYDDYNEEEWDARVTEHYVQKWLCTDQWVGVSVIMLDGEPVVIVKQNARKADRFYEFVSREAFEKMRDFVNSLVIRKDPPVAYVDLDKEIGETFNLEYHGQILDKHGIYKGQTVEVLRRRVDYSEPLEMWHKTEVSLPNGEVELVELTELHFPYNLDPAKD